MSKGIFPEGWGQCELSVLGNIVTGKTPSTKEPSYFGGDIPFIKPGDLEFGGNINKTSDTLTDKGLAVVPTLPPSSIVVTCIGNLGKVGITTKRSATNQQINSFIPNPRLCVKFIYYQMLTLKPWLESQSVATTIAIVNKGRFSQAPIKLPAAAEQKIIAEKLDTLLAQVDSTKARLEQIPQILKRFRQAVLAAAVSGRLISNLNNNNSHRKNLKFEDILKSKKQLSYGVLKPGDYDEHGVPMIRVMDIGEWGNFNKTDIFKISQSLSFEFKRTIVEEGDVVLSIMATIGRAAIVPKHLAGANVNRALAVIKLSDQVIPKYILLQLHSPQFQESFVDKQMGSAQKRINLADLRMFDIWIPSIEHQHEIVRRVEQLFVYADTIEKQVNNALTRVNNLTQSILAKAFRGELTAQWRAENPELISGENSAAALLEKIKAERTASGSKKASRKKT